MFVLLGSGCVNLLGIEDVTRLEVDAGTSGNSDRVTGILQTYHVTETSLETAPVDLRGAIVEALIRDGDAYDRIGGSGESDGTFAIEDVPPGEYVLRIDDIFLVTSERDVDVGAGQAGRQDATEPTRETTLDLDLDGLSRFVDDNSIDLSVPNVGLLQSVVADLKPPLQVGVTTVTGQMPALKLIDGDRTSFLHYTQPSRIPSTVLTQIARPPNLSVTDGSNAEVTASFESVALDQSFVADFRGSEFAAQRSSVAVGTSSSRASLRVYRLV